MEFDLGSVAAIPTGTHRGWKRGIIPSIVKSCRGLLRSGVAGPLRRAPSRDPASGASRAPLVGWALAPLFGWHFSADGLDVLPAAVPRRLSAGLASGLVAHDRERGASSLFPVPPATRCHPKMTQRNNLCGSQKSTSRILIRTDPEGGGRGRKDAVPTVTSCRGLLVAPLRPLCRRYQAAATNERGEAAVGHDSAWAARPSTPRLARRPSR